MEIKRLLDKLLNQETSRREFLIGFGFLGATLAGVGFGGCEQKKASTVKQPSLSSSPSNEFNLEPFNECAEFLEEIYTKLSKDREIGGFLAATSILWHYFIEPTNHALINDIFWNNLQRKGELIPDLSPFELNLIDFVRCETPAEYLFPRVCYKGPYDERKKEKEKIVRKIDEKIEEALKMKNLKKEDIEDWGTMATTIKDEYGHLEYAHRPFLYFSDGTWYLLIEFWGDSSEFLPEKIGLGSLNFPFEIEDILDILKNGIVNRYGEKTTKYNNYFSIKGKEWVKLVKSHDETYPLRLKYRDLEPRKKIAAQEAILVLNNYVEREWKDYIKKYGEPDFVKDIRRELEQIL